MYIDLPNLSLSHSFIIVVVVFCLCQILFLLRLFAIYKAKEETLKYTI